LGRGKVIQVVIYDCDNTIWTHYDVSILKRPFKKIDDMVIDSVNEVVKLNPGLVETLKILREKNIKIGVASFNIPEAAIDILKLFSIYDLIDYPVIEYHPYKDRMIKKIIKMASRDLGKVIKLNNVIFIDDDEWTIKYVSRRLPKLIILRYGYDIKNHAEVLNYIDP